MIADLIGRSPGSPGHVLSDREQIGGTVIVQRDQLASANISGEARAGFDGELIERKMFGPEGQSARELALPLRQALARSGIDEIDRDA